MLGDSVLTHKGGNSFMSMYRKPVNKSGSAKHFRHNVAHTKAANLPSRRSIMRGGQRM